MRMLFDSIDLNKNFAYFLLSGIIFDRKKNIATIHWISLN